MSGRYETNYWKKEDWEAHNRLKHAAIERQREEFLEDFTDIWISANMESRELPYIFYERKKKWEAK